MDVMVMGCGHFLNPPPLYQNFPYPHSTADKFGSGFSEFSLISAQSPMLYRQEFPSQTRDHPHT